MDGNSSEAGELGLYDGRDDIARLCKSTCPHTELVWGSVGTFLGACVTEDPIGGCASPRATGNLPIPANETSTLTLCPEPLLTILRHQGGGVVQAPLCSAADWGNICVVDSAGIIGRTNSVGNSDGSTYNVTRIALGYAICLRVQYVYGVLRRS